MDYTSVAVPEADVSVTPESGSTRSRIGEITLDFDVSALTNYDSNDGIHCKGTDGDFWGEVQVKENGKLYQMTGWDAEQLSASSWKISFNKLINKSEVEFVFPQGFFYYWDNDLQDNVNLGKVVIRYSLVGTKTFSIGDIDSGISPARTSLLDGQIGAITFTLPGAAEWTEKATASNVTLKRYKPSSSTSQVTVSSGKWTFSTDGNDAILAYTPKTIPMTASGYQITVKAGTLSYTTADNLYYENKDLTFKYYVMDTVGFTSTYAPADTAVADSKGHITIDFVGFTDPSGNAAKNVKFFDTYGLPSLSFTSATTHETVDYGTFADSLVIAPVSKTDAPFQAMVTVPTLAELTNPNELTVEPMKENGDWTFTFPDGFFCYVNYVYLKGFSITEKVTGLPTQSDPTSGITVLGNDQDGDVEYYNLQGQRVDSPKAGNIYIRRAGNKVTKVVM